MAGIYRKPECERHGDVMLDLKPVRPTTAFSTFKTFSNLR